MDDKISKRYLIIGKILLGLQLAYFILGFIGLLIEWNRRFLGLMIIFLIPILILLPCFLMVNNHRIGTGRLLIGNGLVLAVIFVLGIFILDIGSDFNENIILLSCCTTPILIFYILAGLLFIQSGIRYRNNKIISQTKVDQ